MEVFTCFILGMPEGCDQRGWVVVRQVPVVCTCNRVGIPDYGHSQRSLCTCSHVISFVMYCACVQVEGSSCISATLLSAKSILVGA